MVVRGWPERGGPRGADAARLLACLLRLEGPELIETFIAEVPAAGRYDGAENAALAQAALLLPAPRAGALIEAVIAANAPFAPGACAELLAACCIGREHAVDALAPAARTLVDALTGALSKPAEADHWRRIAPPDAALVVHVLTTLQRQGDAALADMAIPPSLLININV